MYCRLLNIATYKDVHDKIDLNSFQLHNYTVDFKVYKCNITEMNSQSQSTGITSKFQQSL